MARKVQNVLTYLFRFIGILIVMFGGSALDSENFVLPAKICIIGMLLLFASVLVENLKHR